MELPFWDYDTAKGPISSPTAFLKNSKWQSHKTPMTHRQHIARLSSIYPNSRVFTELNNFFNSVDDHPRATQVTVADCVDGDFTLQTLCTAPELQSSLGHKRGKASLRMVLLEYQNKRSLDRDMLDVLGTAYSISPIFLYKHIVLNRFGSETPFFASEQDGMELKLQRNFISSMTCRANTADSDVPSTGL